MSILCLKQNFKILLSTSFSPTIIQMSVLCSELDLTRVPNVYTILASSLKVQSKNKGHKAFCHSDLWEIFLPQYQIWHLDLTNVQANWSADIQLVPCPVSDAPKKLCQRELSVDKTQTISPQGMDMVERDTGKPSWSPQFHEVCVFIV